MTEFTERKEDDEPKRWVVNPSGGHSPTAFGIVEPVEVKHQEQKHVWDVEIWQPTI